MYIFRIEKDLYESEFCIYIISFINLTVCSVYCLCIGSLLIYVHRLVDFMSVYGHKVIRNTAAAVGGRSARPLSSNRLEFMYGYNIQVARR